MQRFSSSCFPGRLGTQERALESDAKNRCRRAEGIWGATRSVHDVPFEGRHGDPIAGRDAFRRDGHRALLVGASRPGPVLVNATSYDAKSPRGIAVGPDTSIVASAAGGSGGGGGGISRTVTTTASVSVAPSSSVTVSSITCCPTERDTESVDPRPRRAPPRARHGRRACRPDRGSPVRRAGPAPRRHPLRPSRRGRVRRSRRVPGWAASSNPVAVMPPALPRKTSAAPESPDRWLGGICGGSETP